MSLEIQAYSGMRSGVENPGWNPTNAAFFIAALIAMYGEDFGWPEIQKFKELNDIEEWEPREDLSADGLLLSGTIFTPDGFDLKGWQDYYSAWKSGNLDVSLPPEVDYETTVDYVPDVIGWNPAPSTVIPQQPTTTTAATTAVANSAQSAVNVSQPATITATKKKSESGVPMWVWLAGGATVLAVMAFRKKGRR